MAASTDLATQANVKTYLNISGSDDDTRIDLLIDMASEAIENYCRRKFKSESRTEYCDGGGHSRLVLKERPATSITSIHDDLNRDFAAGSLIDSDNYIVREDEGIVEFLGSGYFKGGQLNVKVVYTAGYSTIPTDVALACIMLVAKALHRGKQGADGIKQESEAGKYSVTYTEGMLLADKDIKELLASYRDFKA